MLKEKTVFILGAGASLDFKFPLGNELLGEIREQCQQFGNATVDRLVASGFHVQKFHDLRALIDETHCLSIDALLATYTDFVDLGKFLIALCLLPREQNAKGVSVQLRPKIWMFNLFNKMAEDCPTISDFAKNPATFVTFNYDRCLEYFLMRELTTRYRAEPIPVMEAMRNIPIIHVHGQLGKLSEVEYGKDHFKRGYDIARKAAAGIKIIHESQQDSPEFEQSRTALADASRVGILGFGYNKASTDRLGFSKLEDKVIYGTCKDMTAQEIFEIKARMPGRTRPFAVLSDCDCLQLLKASELIF